MAIGSFSLPLVQKYSSDIGPMGFFLNFFAPDYIGKSLNCTVIFSRVESTDLNKICVQISKGTKFGNDALTKMKKWGF